jgi:hypothetical protein
LGREIANLAEAAARKTLAGEVATDDLDRITLLQRTRDLLPAPRDWTWLWAIAVAATCMGAVTLVTTVRVPRTVIELEIATGSVTLQLTSAFKLRDAWRVDPDLVKLKNFDHAELPPEFSARPWTGRISLDVQAKDGTAEITAFMAEAGATISLTGSARSAHLTAGGAPVTLQLAVTGHATVDGSDGGGIQCCTEPRTFDDPPGEFQVSGSGDRAIPIELEVTPIHAAQSKDVLQLRDIHVARLGFRHERVDAEQRDLLISDVQSGTLILADTEEKITLAEGAVLQLDRASGVITSLRVTPDGIVVHFSGAVHGLVLGGGDLARDLRPTWLDYLRRQQQVGFLWAGMTFVWGLLWSARQLLLKS